MHQWQKITLVGVGLLGGSLGLAIRKRKLAGQVTGYVRRETSVAECKSAGVADAVTRDLSQAVSDADLIVLCTPLARMRELTERMAASLKRGAIVTDVGSVKGSVVRELEPVIASAGAHFVGSHPMAGSEKTGVGAAKAELFEKAVCVVTPTPDSEPKAVERVEEFWRDVGARTMRLSPELHDELVSRSSHLPHVIAAGLATHVLDPRFPKEQATLCANGFRDTTRIASGSPEMWRDIAVANRDNLGRSLDVFIKELQSFRDALAKNDAAVVEQFFVEARRRREQWTSVSNSPE